MTSSIENHIARNPFIVQTDSNFHPLPQDPRIFAVIDYGTQSSVAMDQLIHIRLALPALGKTKREIWLAKTPPIFGYDPNHQIYYAQNEEFLFGALVLPDQGKAALIDPGKEAYTKIRNFLLHSDCSHLIRIWHYFPAITTKQPDGLDRYQQFCLGRNQASDRFLDNLKILPAATAIGTMNEGFILFFIAAKEAGIQIENPRQVSAYHYPLQYAPKSPSFSRALIKPWDKSVHFYLSGTASIIGHESVHKNAPDQQMIEIIKNLQALSQTATQSGWPAIPLDQFDLFKIYLKDPAFFPQAQEILQPILGKKNRFFLQGDICRHDLLVEIEGFATAPRHAEN